jgi:hypothetical protein
MKRIISIAAVAAFALPLFANAQSYYYPPTYNYGYGQQQQQQQQQGGMYYSQPQYPIVYQQPQQYYQPPQPNYYQYYQQPQYYQTSSYQPQYYQPTSWGSAPQYSIGQYVPNTGSYGYGLTTGSYAQPGAYAGTPNPYLDTGYFTGNYDAFQSPICYFPSYGTADCGSDPREPVYDVWSGTYY